MKYVTMYRILVPVDEAEDRTVQQIEYVTSLPVVPEKVEVLVLHVDEADYAGAPPKEFADVPSATTAVGEITDAGIQCQGEKREGGVARTILDTAESFGADEIVMGGRKRSGVAEVVMGSVTRDIVRSASCAVTVVG